MNRFVSLFAVTTASLTGAACTPQSDFAVITERYVTAADEAMNIDSVATHAGPDGETWLFATAKEGQLIRIYDAASGAHLRDFGGPGTGAGEFQRPNGILAQNGLLIVVERDNHRVQGFSLPELAPLALFGETELIKPYGAYLQAIDASTYRLFVTDAYELENGSVPPQDDLDRRVQIFDLTVERGAAGKTLALNAIHEGAFGATSGEGVLLVVESIWGDPVYDRLLIAEEDPAGGRVIKVYSMAGEFRDQIIGDGIFRSQPEGIALFACADGSGYWITTDQAYGQNVFHLFDRQSLDYVGGFAGAVTDNTDGIWLNQTQMAGFPAGALFAVHDDQAVAAFDWRDIAAALALPAGCT
jgi:3-phytase